MVARKLYALPSGEMMAACDWFDGNVPKSADFPLTSLKLEEEGDSPAGTMGALGGDGGWMR